MSKDLQLMQKVTNETWNVVIAKFYFS
jgi:hypothetical protein